MCLPYLLFLCKNRLPFSINKPTPVWLIQKHDLWELEIFRPFFPPLGSSLRSPWFSWVLLEVAENPASKMSINLHKNLFPFTVGCSQYHIDGHSGVIVCPLDESFWLFHSPAGIMEPYYWFLYSGCMEMCHLIVHFYYEYDMNMVKSQHSPGPTWGTISCI